MYYVGSIPVIESDLRHYGITGMKWGVRRYQNEDGSLTPDGKARYGSKDTGKNPRPRNQRRIEQEYETLKKFTRSDETKEALEREKQRELDRARTAPHRAVRFGIKAGLAVLAYVGMKKLQDIRQDQIYRKQNEAVTKAEVEMYRDLMMHQIVNYYFPFRDINKLMK